MNSTKLFKSATILCTALIFLSLALWYHQHREIQKRRTLAIDLEHQYAEKQRQLSDIEANKKQAEQTHELGYVYVEKFLFEKIPSMGPSGLPHDELLKLSTAIQQLSEVEALQIMQSVKSRDLPKMQKDVILSKLIPSLSSKHPKVTIDFCITNQQLVDPHLTSLCVGSFIKNLLENDPSEAIAWADRKIAENPQMINQKSNPNPLLLAIEEPIVKHCILNDMEIASVHLKALGHQDVMVILQNVATNETNDETLIRWIATVRKTLAPEDCEIQLVTQSIGLAHFDLAKVDHFLKIVGANETEIQRCVAEVSSSLLSRIGNKREVIVSDVEHVRSWAATYKAPLSTVTGFALGQAIGRTNWSVTGISLENALELVKHFHKTSADDQVIASFLSTQARFFVKEALELADEIKDPELRSKVKSTIK